MSTTPVPISVKTPGWNDVSPQGGPLHRKWVYNTDDYGEAHLTADYVTASMSGCGDIEQSHVHITYTDTKYRLTFCKPFTPYSIEGYDHEKTDDEERSEIDRKGVERVVEEALQTLHGEYF